MGWKRSGEESWCRRHCSKGSSGKAIPCQPEPLKRPHGGGGELGKAGRYGSIGLEDPNEEQGSHRQQIAAELPNCRSIDIVKHPRLRTAVSCGRSQLCKAATALCPARQAGPGRRRAQLGSDTKCDGHKPRPCEPVQARIRCPDRCAMLGRCRRVAALQSVPAPLHPGGSASKSGAHGRDKELQSAA